MLSVALLGIVLATVLLSLESMTNSEAYQDDRTANLDTMRTTLNDMTKLLRQGSDVRAGSSATRLDFDSYVSGSPVHVVYSVSGTQLLRQIGGGAQTVVLRDLDATPAAPLFCYTDASSVCGASGGPTTQWVQISLQVTPTRSPSTTLELDSQVNLRTRTAA
jgi:hypothetical protein